MLSPRSIFDLGGFCEIAPFCFGRFFAHLSFYGTYILLPYCSIAMQINKHVRYMRHLQGKRRKSPRHSGQLACSCSHGYRHD